MLRFLYPILLLATLSYGFQPIPSQQRIERLASKKGSFSNNEKGDIEEYVSNWIQILKDGKKEDVSSARKKLSGPLTRKDLSNSFRVTIGNLARKKLEGVLKETEKKHDPTSSLRRLNTYMILSLFGSEEVTWLLTGMTNKKAPKDILEYGILAKSISKNINKNPEPRGSNICDTLQSLEKIKKWTDFENIEIIKKQTLNNGQQNSDLEKIGIALGSIFESLQIIAQIKNSKIEGGFECRDGLGHEKLCFNIQRDLVIEVSDACRSNWKLNTGPLLHALNRCVKCCYNLIVKCPTGEFNTLHKENILFLIQATLNIVDLANNKMFKENLSSKKTMASVFKDIDLCLNWCSQLLGSKNKSGWDMEFQWNQGMEIKVSTINEIKKLQSLVSVQ